MDATQPLGPQVPHLPGFLFFIPVSSLITLVYGATALENAYENSGLKKPEWPSWKSLDKWFLSSGTHSPVRPSSIASINAMAEDTTALDLPTDTDSIWQSEHEWKGLLQAQLIRDPRSIAYWKTWLELDKELGCELLPACASSGEKVRIMVFSRLTRELGCSGSVLRMATYDWGNSEPDQLDSPLFEHNRIADTFAVVFRVCAWVVAEISVRDWEALLGAGLVDEILLKNLTPQFDEQSGHWSRPITEQLRALAADAGYHGDGRPSSFLGEILAGDDSDVSDKQRTLRRWEEPHPGKPRDSVITSLLKALQPLLSKHGGLWSSTSAQNRKFRFAWLNVVLLREMEKKNLPWWHIQEVFDTYEDEFRKARALLGKPLT
ncbi:hypothetical protein [Pseudomonas mandelii]|uniref:Uncharacterized protein n=1 Tax=Pseudomonas mandelii TaxID=75612 RepID=A0A502HQ42_9PSED|nr:hypothetical protein [Pseudomonas mandelii]TPG75496.1 hypothetical protein EAH74_30670 [Pseudomonas mandelii]